MKRTALILAALLALPAFADTCYPVRDKNGRIKRSYTQVKHFRKANPCPGTGLTYGRCYGYEVDHIIPLSCCGADNPSNMQWLSIKAHDVKTIEDNRRCRH